MLRDVFVTLCLLIFVLLKFTIFCLDERYAWHTILGSVSECCLVITLISINFIITSDYYEILLVSSLHLFDIAMKIQKIFLHFFEYKRKRYLSQNF